LPLSEKTDEEVSFEFLIENLREEIQIGNKGCLEDDGNVRSVEQLYGVWLFVTLHSS
jgi:hypothetical protein